MRKSRFPFVPQDSGPTGLAASAPIGGGPQTSSTSTTTTTPAKVLLVGAASSSRPTTTGTMLETTVDHDSPSQALLKLSQTPSDDNRTNLREHAAVLLRENASFGVNNTYYRGRNTTTTNSPSSWNGTTVDSHPSYSAGGLAPMEPQDRPSSNRKHSFPMTSSENSHLQPPPTKQQRVVGFVETTNKDTSLRQHVLDYAAGLALRKSILIPMAQSNSSQDNNLRDLAVDMGLYFRGQRALLLLKDSDTKSNSFHEVQSKQIPSLMNQNYAHLLDWRNEDHDLVDRRDMLQNIGRLLKQQDDFSKWQPMLPKMMLHLENNLYKSAPSLEAYKDTTTLQSRVESLIQSLPFFSNKQDCVDSCNSTGSTGVLVMAKVTNTISSTDATVVRSWYTNSISQGGGDQFLSYSNETWSQEWVDRCTDDNNGSGFEIIKLVSSILDSQSCPKEIILAIALVERFVVDSPSSESSMSVSAKKESSTSTLLTPSTIVHGVRIAPFCNPEVSNRLSFCYREIDNASSNHNEIREYNNPLLPFCATDLLSYLLEDILNRSLVYGTRSVLVHCPKQVMFETFYRSTMGPPLSQDENGQYVFYVNSTDRLHVLRKGFVNYRTLIQGNMVLKGLEGFPDLCNHFASKATSSLNKSCKLNNKYSAAEKTTLFSDAADSHVVNPPTISSRYVGHNNTATNVSLSRVVSDGNAIRVEDEEATGENLKK